MKNKKAQGNLDLVMLILIVSLIVGMWGIMFYTLAFQEPESEELIECKEEKSYIDYKCDDGRQGFVTLKDWGKIHEGCHDYKYYHKCEGINLLIPSERIKW